MTDGRVTDDAPHPPSAAYVLHVLEDAGGELTRQELLDEVGLPERTVDRAIETLQNGDYLVKTSKPDDLRQVVVTLARKR